jgi:hypothetical protein
MTRCSSEDSKVQELEQLCRQLADARAELSLLRDKQKSGSDLVAIITPHNRNAAKIELRLEFDFGVFLLFGEGAPFEVPFQGGYYTRKTWLDDVRALCEAVTTGNFREKLIFVRGELKGSDHELVLPNGRRIVEHWRGPGIVAPWTRKSFREINYEPY